MGRDICWNTPKVNALGYRIIQYLTCTSDRYSTVTMTFEYISIYLHAITD
jgi:hypothetical protein